MIVNWTDEALDRVKEIVEFIFGKNSAQGYHWAKEMFDHVDVLEQFPEMGRMVPEMGRKDFRELIWKGYRIMYRLKSDEVVIHVIRHGRQEWVDPEIED